ncbi:MAG: hypothetical protein ACPGFB_11070 [Verrucomicrobiales bacterium]
MANEDPPSAAHYFYESSSGSTPIGPLSLEDIIKLFDSGVVSAQTGISKEGSNVWRPLESVLERAGVPSDGHGPTFPKDPTEASEPVRKSAVGTIFGGAFKTVFVIFWILLALLFSSAPIYWVIKGLIKFLTSNG